MLTGRCEAARKVGGFAEEFAGLAEARADDEDERVGDREGVVDGLERGDGGLAPLAGAVEQTAGAVGAQDLGLVRVRDEAEALAGEGAGIEAIRIAILFHGRSVVVISSGSPTLAQGPHDGALGLGIAVEGKDNGGVGIGAVGVRVRLRGGRFVALEAGAPAQGRVVFVAVPGHSGSR